MDKSFLLLFGILTITLSPECLSYADKKPLTVILCFDYEDLSHDKGGKKPG